MDKNFFAVIMCGGSGTRFWPASRRKTPKQFLKLSGNSSLIQKTVARLDGLIPAERIYLLAAENHHDLLKRHLPEISEDNYILEPSARNTGPALALAARMIVEISPHAVIAALPADHAIADEKDFRKSLALAAVNARKTKAIVTLGIKPDAPETGYGYIELGEKVSEGVHSIIKFVEKPNLKTALSYLSSGRYLWNSGMFVMSVDTLVSELKLQQPQLYKALWEKMTAPGETGFRASLREIYPTLPGISVDYAVMEKAEHVLCIPADFGWNDLGSWSALEKLWGKDKSGNAANSKYYSIDSKGNVIASAGRDIVIIGVEDLVIVEREDVVLVCAKERCQDLRRMIELLKKDGREDIL